ncbi:hypothetical protein [Sodalis sp. RH20]|uniref:hypothetical protein n=1 Tax=unclassified Sodalis (in: enterobacteria) TaxID=2636512 RepID=UPI0039B4DF3C
MAIKQYDELKTDTDVISYMADDVMAIMVKTFPTLAVAVEPGYVITSAGSLVVSGSTDAFICLDYANAGSNVALRVVVTSCVVKLAALFATDVNKAVALLTADKSIRVADFARSASGL